MQDEVKIANHPLTAFALALLLAVEAVPTIVTGNPTILVSTLGFATLLIHEAGHFIFFFFGTTIGYLGGTIFQLFVPAAFSAWAWFVRREYATTFLAAAWLGLSFYDSGKYIADARAKALPLFMDWTGSKTGHDWAYLLTEWGVLEYDAVLGKGAKVCGGTIVFAALAALLLPICRLVWEWFRAEK